MRIIAFIEDPDIIKKILKHLDLWDVKARPPPKNSSENLEPFTDYSQSQILPSEDYLYCNVEYAEAK